MSENERQKAYNTEYVEYRGQHIHVSELPDNAVTTEDLAGIPMSTYNRERLAPKLTDAALIERAKQYLKQTTPKATIATYEDALIQNILPELIRRLE